MKSFIFEGQEQPISFVETMHVAKGAECDVYGFVGDPSKDLGIIRIRSGSRTPLQRVLKGDRTVEGYISGKGKLTVTKLDGMKTVYKVGENLQEPLVVSIGIGELMQWEADINSDLVVYEVCFPPYEDGRYENIK